MSYQHEAEAVEQAFRLVELCAKSFQRAVRQLANIRLGRAKTARTKRRERVKTIHAGNWYSAPRRSSKGDCRPAHYTSRRGDLQRLLTDDSGAGEPARGGERDCGRGAEA